MGSCCGQWKGSGWQKAVGGRQWRNVLDMIEVGRDVRNLGVRVRPSVSDSIYERVYALVRRVPRGRVVTYGQVARALGMPRGARTVGWAMRVCQDPRVPWHRVVNAQGKVSLRPTMGYQEQRARLKEEGVRFDCAGKIDLGKYAWKRL